MSKHNGDERREGCDFAVPDALSRQIGKSFEAARDLADADALRKALRLHLEEPGVSQASVARAIDRSGAAVSQWLRNEYRGDNEAVEAAIRSYLETAQKRAAVHAVVPAAGFAATSVANEVLQVCSWAHTHGTVGVVYGEAGMGKTCATREYQRLHPETAIVTCDPMFTRTSALLDETAHEVLRKDVSQKFTPSPHRVLRDLADALRGSGRLVIFDEAQFLKREGVETIRSLHDRTGVGIVLCGNYDVFQRMQGGASAAVFAQVFSRIGARRRITLSATRDDVKAICGDVGGEVLRYLHARAKEPGGFRRMVAVWRTGVEFARAEGRDVSVGDLQLAESALFGAAGAA